jgi:hypothetical protein
MIWSLLRPDQSVVASRQFTASDTNRNSTEPIFLLAPGDYELLIDGTGATTSSYQVRLLDLDSAVTITPGTPVEATLNPASETDL